MDRDTHAKLALKEAKAMVKSRQKRKTSRIICHHLLMMLDEDVQPRAYPYQPNRLTGNNGRRQYSLRF
jgi:hypothetical protein